MFPKPAQNRRFLRLFFKMQVQMPVNKTERNREKRFERMVTQHVRFPLYHMTTNELFIYLLNISNGVNADACHIDVHWGLFLKSSEWQKDFVLEFVAHQPFNLFVLFAFLL